MSTKKNEPPHWNGKTAHTDVCTSVSIIPKNSTKIKDEFIKYLRAKGIQSKDMVAVVSGTYTKYDKYLQSKVENGESYGVELRNDAIDALLAVFAPEKAAEVKRKRGGGHKLQKTIFARLPDKMYEQLHATIKAKGFSSVQSWLTYIVTVYLQKEAVK